MFLSPKEFAIACGVAYSTLRKHVSRGKVHKSGDFIDTDYELNKNYVDEQTNGTGLDLAKIKSESKSSPPKKNGPSKKDKPKPPDVDESPSSIEPTREEILANSLTLRRKKADLELAERNSELKRLEIQKKMGELMPIELVENILTVNIQTVFRSFEAEAENVASIYCDVLGDRSQLSEMVGQMREHLQKTISEVKSKAADEVKKAIMEYTEVRSRGEKK